MPQPVPILSLLLLLAATPAAPAARAYLAPLEDVVAQAEHILRGRINLEERTVEVLQEYRGRIEAPRIRVENLRQFGPVGAPWDENHGAPHPSEALLMLEELDGRYYLVHRRVPHLVPPYSSIFPIAGNGRILSYSQPIAPGDVCLTPASPDLATFEKALQRLLIRRPKPGRPSGMTAEELDRFYDVISPYVDYYRRDVVRPGGAEIHWEPRGNIDLVDAATRKAYAEKLSRHARTSRGEALRRGLEVLLILTRQLGVDQSRRELFERCLQQLLPDVDRGLATEVLLDELASKDPLSSKRSAAFLLVALGGDEVDTGIDLLRQHILQGSSNVATSSYYALCRVGRQDLADAAQQEANASKK